MAKQITSDIVVQFARVTILPNGKQVACQKAGENARSMLFTVEDADKLRVFCESKHIEVTDMRKSSKPSIARRIVIEPQSDDCEFPFHSDQAPADWTGFEGNEYAQDWSEFNAPLPATQAMLKKQDAKVNPPKAVERTEWKPAYSQKDMEPNPLPKPVYKEKNPNQVKIDELRLVAARHQYVRYISAAIATRGETVTHFYGEEDDVAAGVGLLFNNRSEQGYGTRVIHREEFQMVSGKSTMYMVYVVVTNNNSCD